MRYRVSVILMGLAVATSYNKAFADEAQKLPPPTVRTEVGGFFGTGDHVFFVETEVRLPLIQLGDFALNYEHRESIAFLKLKEKDLQGDWLYARERMRADFKLMDNLAILAVAGYNAAYAEDRAGHISAYSVGGGFGSPQSSKDQRLQWWVLAGAYLSRENLGANWWTDAYASWRLLDFAEEDYLRSHYRASLLLAGSVESANEDDRFHALYRVGPELQMTAGNGNQAKLKFQWFHNDNDPFFGSDVNGMLASFEVTSSLDSDRVFNAREERKEGWLPLVWGSYDVGLGSSRFVQTTDLNVELVDLKIREHLFTGVVWYESRQEQRSGDFDNMAYSVSVGVQTPIGLKSVLSHGDPLVAGLDFLHRSDHALNPDPARVAAVGIPTQIGTVIDNTSLNVFPRLRLQTLGWGLPYREASIYERKTDWINNFDWLATAGYTIKSNRDRGAFSGQLGLNWDVATVNGYVFYVKGIGSVGDETPDWSGEAGIRRPRGALFVRFEQYGMKRDVARGDTFVGGIRFSL